MKNIWNIYLTDLKSIMKNPTVAIILGGLIILPSLYAWLNIFASWDPYAKTDQIPVGIVNEDKGATIRENDIHVGDELVDSLRENNDFKWEFVDRDTAMKEVEYGNYYAVIIVPENFSETLGSVVTDDPTKAEIEYYVNEKINAISPKITEKGASLIVEQISSQFTSTVNGIIFDIFNDLGIELEAKLPDIEKLESYIFKLENELPNIHALLLKAEENAAYADEMLGKAEGMIPTLKSTVEQGLGTVTDVYQLLDKAERILGSISETVGEDLQDFKEIYANLGDALASIDEDEIGKYLDDLSRIDDEISTTISTIDNMIEQLETIDAESSEVDDEVVVIIEGLNEFKSSLEHMNESIANLSGVLGNFDKQYRDEIEKLNEVFAETDIEDFVESELEVIEDEMVAKIQENQNRVKEIEKKLLEVQRIIPEAEKLLSDTKESLHDGQKMLAEVLEVFPTVQEKVTGLANQVRMLQGEADLQDIIKLLQNDPDKERSFFAEPVLLNKNEVFPIENYGTGMTPFYTVLAIWVGALLLISLLSTDSVIGGEWGSRQIYSGKLFTFLTIGILQTLIVTLGDIFIVGVEVSHPVWFIVFGIFISMIFMTAVYTLVSTFGDVGKAMAIILLVLQISSSGGTYPVVLLPEFFQAINPILPFTYAVDLMREAVGGIVWGRVLWDILFLVIIWIVFLLVGIFAKGPINKQMNKFLKSKDSHLFH